MSLSRDERKKALQQRLQTARQESADIAEAIDYYGALIAALIDEQVQIEPPALDAAQVADKLAAGEPILHGESLGFDEDGIRAVLVRLCEVTEQFGKVPADIVPRRLSWLQSLKAEREPAFARGVAAAQLRRTLANGDLDFDALMEHLVAGHDDQMALLSQNANVDANLLATLARFAMRPTMTAFAEAFDATVRVNEGGWQRGECPVCGSPPALSEYYDQEQVRRMRCATCGASWKHRHMQCAHCGSDQFHALKFVQLAGDAVHRVDACDVCKHYVKGVQTLDPIASDLLPLEDLLTLSFDAAAEQQGYVK